MNSFYICQVIFVSRNAYDMIVSDYNFSRLLKHNSFQGSLSDFTEAIVKDLGIHVEI